MQGKLQAFKPLEVRRVVRNKTFIYSQGFDRDMIFSQPTLKGCNSPNMQYYFKRFFVLHSSEVIFLFLIKNQGKEIEIAFFHSLGNPKDRTLDQFSYALHIRHNFAYKLIPISMS